MTEIIVSAIGAVATILTVVISGQQSRKNMVDELRLQQERADAKLSKAQAITDTKLETLTREVQKHNNFAQRMPVIEEQIKVVNHRIADLENKTA